MGTLHPVGESASSSQPLCGTEKPGRRRGLIFVDIRCGDTMHSSPGEKPFQDGAASLDIQPLKYRVWSPEEWVRIPPDRRPREVMRFGSGRARWCTAIGRAPRGATTGTRRHPMGGWTMNERVDLAAMAGCRHVWTEGIIVDPEVPTIREFLRLSVMDGLIRTVPAGQGRVLILPSAAPTTPAPAGPRPPPARDRWREGGPPLPRRPWPTGP